MLIFRNRNSRSGEESRRKFFYSWDRISFERDQVTFASIIPWIHREMRDEAELLIVFSSIQRTCALYATYFNLFGKFGIDECEGVSTVYEVLHCEPLFRYMKIMAMVETFSLHKLEAVDRYRR